MHQQDADDDSPPDLSDLPTQVDALRIAHTAFRPASDACTTQAEVSYTSTAALGGGRDHAKSVQARSLRRGFFDSKPTKRQPGGSKGEAKHKHAQEQDSVELVVGKQIARSQRQASKPGITVLSAKGKEGAGRTVPQDFIIPPSEEQKRYLQTRNKLVEALQPTQDTVKDVMGNADLLAGFDDPEVMAAVSEIAADPRRMDKYRSQPKVQRFYQQMGALMAGRCEEASRAAIQEVI